SLPQHTHKLTALVKGIDQSSLITLPQATPKALNLLPLPSTETQKHFNKKIRWGIYGGAALASNLLRNFQNNAAAEGFESVDYLQVNIRSTNESLANNQVNSIYYPRWHFNAGILAEWRTSEKWGMQANLGIMRSENGLIQSGFTDFATANDFINGVGNFSSLSIDNRPERIRATQLDLGFQLNRYWGKEKSRWMAFGGLQAGLNLNKLRILENALNLDEIPSSIYNPANDPDPDAPFDYRRMNLDVHAGIFRLSPLSSQYDLFWGPEIRYHVRDWYSGVLARNQPPLLIGFKVGVKMN
ncbi:MAG: outer membrane beta-barrel protein, partial [Bacteroidota bacterium]